MLLRILGSIENLRVIHLVLDEVALLLGLSAELLRAILGGGWLDSGGVAYYKFVFEAIILVELKLMDSITGRLVH